MKKSGWAKLIKRFALIFTIAAIALLAGRIYDTERGPALEPWHTYVPTELRADQLDTKTWDDYLRQEDKIFASVRKNVTDKLDPETKISSNRYFDGSPIYPEGFKQDWNRSYVLEPEGAPKGAVVFLHGLTDSPYSLRHIARVYRDLGFVAVAIRLPAHGTVPAALTDVVWEDWLAATRLAIREARRRGGPDVPLHLVGFSNGGALAMKYTLDALENDKLTKPDRLVLISPMIGVTSFARFAGLAGLPAMLPAFAKSAWLSIVPEFNPFKYNSFPVNGARQSHRLTTALQAQIQAQSRSGALTRLPPVITFQSVLDFTVSTRAIISAMYAQLPANGSELVLFDLNRTTKFGPLFRSATDLALTRMLQNPPRNYTMTVITNAAANSNEVVERVTPAGEAVEQVRPLGLDYPRDVYSLSHVALPFPTTDALYGQTPDSSEDFGVNLGSTSMRGEVGVLIVNLDSLMRMSSNPFFPYMQERIERVITQGK